MAYVGPDLSDSDISDDDYVTYDQKPKKVNRWQEPKILTEEEKLNQQKNQLYAAICSGNVLNVIDFLDHGVDLNINLQGNWTPLLLTVSFGNVQLTEELLKRGADPNSMKDGCTALMMACNCPKETSPYKNSANVIQQLVKMGADVKKTNRKRMTALMFAANMGNLPAVKYLLPLSDKEAEDNQHWTALFWAVNSNEVEVSKYLLENEMDYTKPDVRNNTPMDIAKSNGFTEIVQLFPKEESDDVSNIIHANILSFDDIFSQTEKGKVPAFFLDICDMLSGMKSESLITQFAEKNIQLHDFLSITDGELEQLGVKMPYQRYRILAGLHKFHKYPFHPKSLHVVPLTETYSNIDVGIQILSAIKQFTTMEAGLNYLINHCKIENISEEDLVSMKRNVENIKRRIRMCSKVTNKISNKTKIWDKQIVPADLITKYSKRFKWPWRKMIFSATLISIIILFRIRK